MLHVAALRTHLDVGWYRFFLSAVRNLELSATTLEKSILSAPRQCVISICAPIPPERASITSNSSLSRSHLWETSACRSLGLCAAIFFC